MFAVSLLMAGYLSRAGAYALLGLFLTQFALAWLLPPDLRVVERIGLAVLYMVLAATLLIRRREPLYA